MKITNKKSLPFLHGKTVVEENGRED